MHARVDAQDHRFTVNRRNLTDKEKAIGKPSEAIIEFDPAGNVVHAWTPDVLPDNLHGCLIDYQGNVWIGGNQDAIVQKSSHDGLRTPPVTCVLVKQSVADAFRNSN